HETTRGDADGREVGGGKDLRCGQGNRVDSENALGGCEQSADDRGDRIAGDVQSGGVIVLEEAGADAVTADARKHSHRATAGAAAAVGNDQIGNVVAVDVLQGGADGSTAARLEAWTRRPNPTT